MNTPQPVYIRALEGALNRYLNLDPDTPSRFAALTGKIIAVELEGLGRTIYFAPEPDGVHILAEYADVPDATLRGTPWALLRMGSLQSDSRAAREALALGAVRIGGDVELGQRFKQILDAVEIDWEEHLSGLVGDLLAHKLGNAARAVQGWGRQATATLGQDFAEYHQEEAYNLPRPDDVRNFIGAVDTLRDDVERLEQRVARLRSRLEAATDKKT